MVVVGAQHCGRSTKITQRTRRIMMTMIIMMVGKISIRNN
jgi:hypothetical protein